MFNGKKSVFSRVLAMILTITMIVQNVPVTAYAAPEGYGSVESNELWLIEDEGEQESKSEGEKFSDTEDAGDQDQDGSGQDESAQVEQTDSEEAGKKTLRRCGLRSKRRMTKPR